MVVKKEDSVMATCDDCNCCKDKADGKGLCKKEHPTTHFTLANNKTIRRDDGWPIVDLDCEACGDFE
jgi:hypothetical protein